LSGAEDSNGNRLRKRNPGDLLIDCANPFKNEGCERSPRHGALQIPSRPEARVPRAVPDPAHPPPSSSPRPQHCH
jgi:hypothetical protein